mmetsp:Transcript_5659/g.17067  ORF Transcript_5659/g.17067 Transcript_5659/m.17067 type:complete len:231 (-) Transcript_5659:761-1453(-)
MKNEGPLWDSRDKQIKEFAFHPVSLVTFPVLAVNEVLLPLASVCRLWLFSRQLALHLGGQVPDGLAVPPLVLHPKNPADGLIVPGLKADLRGVFGVKVPGAPEAVVQHVLVDVVQDPLRLVHVLEDRHDQGAAACLHGRVEKHREDVCQGLAGSPHDVEREPVVLHGDLDREGPADGGMEPEKSAGDVPYKVICRQECDDSKVVLQLAVVEDRDGVHGHAKGAVPHEHEG